MLRGNFVDLVGLHQIHLLVTVQAECYKAIVQSKNEDVLQSLQTASKP